MAPARRVPAALSAPFLAVAALVFALSAAITVAWSTAMATHVLPMPGGWTLSVAWMRMPGQTWAEVVVAFLGMWVVMMVAMMLPSLVPMLDRYRRAVTATGGRGLGSLTAIAGAGYFLVWAAIGMAVFAVGVGMAALGTEHPALARAAPIAGGLVVVLAGALQFTPWKARQLACCREASMRPRGPATGAAWRHGLRLGLDCSRCCAGPMAVLLVVGVMDLRAMAAVAAAITAERLAGPGERIARAIGLVAIGVGLLLIWRPAL